MLRLRTCRPSIRPWPRGHRLQSTAQEAALSKARARLNTLLSQFDNISIYQAGTVRTVLVGLGRVATILLFAQGTFNIAPSLLSSSAADIWWAPLVVLGSAVPMLLTPIASAPFVSTMRMKLPKHARSSVDSALSYAKSVPPDTELTIQHMRWIPWPRSTTFTFDQLRRLPEGTSETANLTILPNESIQKRLQGASWLSQLYTRRMHCRLLVDRDSPDRSSAPGVLNLLWDQIPVLGEAPTAQPTIVKPTTVIKKGPLRQVPQPKAYGKQHM